MAFNGTEGKAIDQKQAATWTRGYRTANPGGVQSRFFGRDVLTAILRQEGCVGVRFYYGLNGTGPQLLAVGADRDENDQLGDAYVVADETPKGPPYSGQSNSMNS